MSRGLRRRVRPHVLLRMSTVAAAVTGLASVVSVALLMWPLVARIPEVAAEGLWRPQDVSRADPVPRLVSLAATVAALVVVARLTRVVRRLRRDRHTLTELHRSIALLGGTDVVVELPDPAVGAYAVPRLRRYPARIVVTSAMTELLTPHEVEAVIAHERVHLARHHRGAANVAALAAALNPVLDVVRQDIDVLIERCADEDAAAGTGRAITLRALARAALAGRPGAVRPATLAHGQHAVAERVAALAAPPVRRRWPAVLLVALVTVSAVTAFRSVVDTEQVFEALRHARGLLVH
jgi:beta-lactamase regulating signal transducer with metallopeptidase domain